MLSVGTLAPDFELVNQVRQPVRLSSFRGRQHVVLAFHPLAFTPVCSAQVQSYERERPRLNQLGAHVLGVNTDLGPAKKAWADALGGVSFDLLSDAYPQGQVATAYGVMGEGGLVERAVFVIDREGVIRWARRYAMDDHPDVQDVIAALAAL